MYKLPDQTVGKRMMLEVSGPVLGLGFRVPMENLDRYTRNYRARNPHEPAAFGELIEEIPLGGPVSGVGVVLRDLGRGPQGGRTVEALVYTENSFEGARAEALEALLAYAVTRTAEASSYLLMEVLPQEEVERIRRLYREEREEELMDLVEALFQKYGLSV